MGDKYYVAKRPPMGWNSWDCYGASVTEDIVRQNAEFMAKHLKQYGWEYVQKGEAKSRGFGWLSFPPTPTHIHK